MKLKAILLTCGILSSILYILADIVSVSIWSDYHFTSQSVSELFAVDSPTRTFVVIWFIVYAFLIYAFGIGIWRTADDKRSLKVAAILIIGKEILGLTGTLFFPLHLRGVEGNYSDIMHDLVTTVGFFLFMLPAMIAGAVAFKGIFRIYSIATITLFIFFGFLESSMHSQYVANLPTPMLGIWERIIVYGYMIWIVILSIKLLKSMNKQSVR